MKILILLLLFACSEKYQLSGDIKKESHKICLNSEGNGRLVVNDQKYVFSYDSLMERDNHKWSLELDFPLRNPENFELDWSENNKMKFNSSIDQKILRENKEINPKELDRFVKAIGYFLKDIVKLQDDKNSKLSYNWVVGKKDIQAFSAKKSAKLLFENLDADGYFKKMSISYQSSKKQSYKMEFLVRKCFKNGQVDTE